MLCRKNISNLLYTIVLYTVLLCTIALSTTPIISAPPVSLCCHELTESEEVLITTTSSYGSIFANSECGIGNRDNNLTFK